MINTFVVFGMDVGLELSEVVFLSNDWWSLRDNWGLLFMVSWCFLYGVRSEPTPTLFLHNKSNIPGSQLFSDEIWTTIHHNSFQCSCNNRSCDVVTYRAARVLLECLSSELEEEGGIGGRMSRRWTGDAMPRLCCLSEELECWREAGSASSASLPVAVCN